LSGRYGKIYPQTRLFWWRQPENQPFAIISTDGDSDRPLLTDENGTFLPGDKLGALASLYLETDGVALPVSSNDGIVSLLNGSNITVRMTKIGSPYVIKAMVDLLAENPSGRVDGWEVNGGFLLGSSREINGEKSSRLFPPVMRFCPF